MTKYNILIVGAGPVGSVIAEQCASQLNWKVQLIDKRPHIAGNCYDRFHESGVLIHQYGPHYFRTNKASLLEYLSQFTEWIPGNYIVTSNTRGEHFPFPINLDTLAQFFKLDHIDEEKAKQLLEEKREKIETPKNSEEFVLSRVGKELYEAFYLGYTLKQWDMHPKDLAPSVCGRIPIRFNQDNRYVDHEFQFTPKDGFSKMFEKMISHPLIDLQLNTDFKQIKEKPPIIVYSGAIDEYFDFQYGKLGWRSLSFDFQVKNEEYYQKNVQINYPNEHKYTRSVEIKHVTGQKHPQTVISYEYPKATGDPYYPIPTTENHEKYLKYKKLADEETTQNHVYFCGRLAEYKYFNMDEVMENAFRTFKVLKSKYGNQ
ncbi:MAG: UDP-galactopyranose mutase [Chitinophagaceae bacterium]|nr:MAG: UDP-galactopyranose mutase [Bacteroidetes bacterium OLB11]MCC6447239.1 UDP-galactopyranose mutase [Chitinophagaceae bacterium]HMN32833.1 UDP-galactopyranose mutase [Chitinophagaceae bacterium]